MSSLFHIETYRRHKTKFRFFILFVLFYILGIILHFLTLSYTTPFFVYKLNAGVSSKIINVISPNEKTIAEGPIISSNSVSISIEKGCEGTEGIILLTAAILAFPSRNKKKILAIIFGSVIIYLSNIIRIIVLYYIFRFKPEYFDFMHVFVGQTFIIFICVLLFISWTNILAKNHDEN